MRAMLVSQEGQESAENARRTLRDFTGDLSQVVSLLGLDPRVGEAQAYWGNGPTQPAGRDATRGVLLQAGDVLGTARFQDGAAVLVSVARVLAHTLVPSEQQDEVLRALPNDRRNPRWRGAANFLNDLIFLERPLDLAPVPLDRVNRHLQPPYRAMGNRFPSRTVQVLDGHEQALLEELLSPAGVAGWHDPQQTLRLDDDRARALQQQADHADLGDTDTDTDGAYGEGSQRRRTRQRAVQSEAFRYYGRVCAACGDRHPWRVEFAHLLRYGRAAAERWYCGIPLCRNHHADLDEQRLRLCTDYTWQTEPGCTLAELAVTASTVSDFLDSHLKPSKKVLALRATPTAAVPA